jgi:hypothetical protein
MRGPAPSTTGSGASSPMAPAPSAPANSGNK